MVASRTFVHGIGSHLSPKLQMPTVTAMPTGSLGFTEIPGVCSTHSPVEQPLITWFWAISRFRKSFGEEQCHGQHTRQTHQKITIRFREVFFNVLWLSWLQYVEFQFSFTNTFLDRLFMRFMNSLQLLKCWIFHPSILWSRCGGSMCHHETTKTYVDCFYMLGPVRFEKSQEIWGTKYVNSI